MAFSSAKATASRTQLLADQFGAQVQPLAWDAVNGVLPRVKLLVNTTSLGMKGQPPLGVDVTLLPATAAVADLVYVPLETDLLKAAKARGLKTADGLGMLLHQAVRGFELWFGKRPRVTPELRALRLRRTHVISTRAARALRNPYVSATHRNWTVCQR